MSCVGYFSSIMGASEGGCLSGFSAFNVHPEKDGQSDEAYECEYDSPNYKRI